VKSCRLILEALYEPRGTDQRQPGHADKQCRSPGTEFNYNVRTAAVYVMGSNTQPPAGFSRRISISRATPEQYVSTNSNMRAGSSRLDVSPSALGRIRTIAAEIVVPGRKHLREMRNGCRLDEVTRQFRLGRPARAPA